MTVPTRNHPSHAAKATQSTVAAAAQRYFCDTASGFVGKWTNPKRPAAHQPGFMPNQAVALVWVASCAMDIGICRIACCLSCCGLKKPICCGLSRKVSASCQTRCGDWVMRVRFRGENTRETKASERQRLSTRAFHPEARSHNPITAPGFSGEILFLQ